ncbi:hypothetical protein DRO69_01585 [Candidatus Bathyarchaeota archaeon]|nr:MAG: hypothetical protein DRO69_01585 [Candidatus Bathyarchaeota archaeon]
MSPNVWREFRVVGVEDGSFCRESLNYNTDETLLVCILFRRNWIESFQADTIKVDGLDASNKLITMLHQWVFDAVMLAGISFAGFNLVDPTLVFEEFHKPVIVISRTKPDNIAVKNALLQHFEDWRIRWSIFEKLGPVYSIVSIPNEPPLYVEVVGTTPNWATKLIRASAICCRVPESIRVARLVARGLTRKPS